MARKRLRGDLLVIENHSNVAIKCELDSVQPGESTKVSESWFKLNRHWFKRGFLKLAAGETTTVKTLTSYERELPKVEAKPKTTKKKRRKKGDEEE